MPDFQGKFQYTAPGAGTGQEGSCVVEFDEQSFTLTPAAGASLAFDLGDLDAVVPDNYEVRLPLYTGSTVVLRHFGKAYDNLAKQLLESYRKRAMQCLLLEDLQEVDRFTGSFSHASGASGPAEFRLFKSNLAVLPSNSQSFQWRLADVDDITLDDNAYEVRLTSNSQWLKISKLARRTEEFRSKVEQTMAALAAQSTQALHGTFPFLNPDQLQSAARVLREGGCAPVAKLDLIHPKFSAALSANAVDKNLKPYFDELLKLTAAGQLYAGFKLIRDEEVEAEPGAQDEPADAAKDSSDKSDTDSAGPAALYWFYFPLAAKSGSTDVENVIGWEASSASGRATYFFRLVDPANAAELRDPNVRDAAVRRLNRVLGMLNFRRRPIYLSNKELEMDARFRRYAIAARRIPELREVRANFLGRAIHGSVETWQAQVAAVLAKPKGRD
jgi:hypothetical protein